MSAFLAIVGDTWRQSKQQVVLIILIVLMLLIAIGSTIVVRPVPSVFLDNADGRLTTEDLRRISAELEGAGEVDRLGGMFSPGGMRRGKSRSADYVVTFDTLDQARAAARTLETNERLRGAAAVTSDGAKLVFEAHHFAEDAAKILEEEAADASDPGFERKFEESGKTLSDFDISVRWTGDPVLEFPDPEAAENALQVLLDSSFIRELSSFAAKAEPRFGFIWSDTPNEFLYGLWEQAFVAAASLRDGGKVDPETLRKRYEETSEDREAILARKNHLEISTESFLGQVVMWLVFTVTMLLFIAASASYFPGMLASGAVDVVVSRPVSRLRIFLGRYFGGLVLYAGIVFGTAFLLWAGMGVRLGYWPHRIFIGAGLLFFSGAVIYALLAFLGVLTRSTPLGIILGLVYYFVIDTVLSTFYDVSAMGAFEDYPTVETIANSMRTVFPNFGQLKGTAQASILTMPYMDWTPLYTGGAWLVGSLALGYLIFRRKDY